MTGISSVDFSRYHGGGSFDDWLQKACQYCGVTENEYWQKGMKILCERESSLNPNAVNTYDKNANGAIAPDRHPQNCSRGIAQCIPSTFAMYHSDGTSWCIYDPVASIAASINYAIHFYGVSRDGSDLARKIQQADPARGAHGYIVLDTV